MQKLLVMTDLHIGDFGETIIGLDAVHRFSAVLDDALSNHGDAQALILMGDLTHHGRVSQYARLRECLAQVTIPVTPMLGNHDRRGAFVDVFPQSPQCEHGFIQTIADLPDHRIITLDSLDGPPYPPGHHAGRLCDRRIAWLETALLGAQGRMPLVFVHHPPFDTGIVGMDDIKLADPEPLLTLLKQYNAHLFCGHIHRTISGSSQGVPWTMFKSTCHQGVLDFQEVDSSLSIDEPGAYGVLILGPNHVAAHSVDVGLEATPMSDPHSA